MDVFIIIPVYNEAKVIDALSNFKNFPEYKVVIVDDASTDKPDFENLPISFSLISHSINLGQGAALQTGMEYALAKNAAIIVHFDADGQHDFKDIGRMIEPIKKEIADVVIGSRFLKNKNFSIKLNIPFKKIIVLQIARYVQFIFTGVLLSDSQNGFRAFSNKAGLLTKITENRMAHAIEIVQIIKWNKLRIKEIPVVITYSDYSIKKGQKLINGFFIVFRLFKKTFFKNYVNFTLLLIIFSFLIFSTNFVNLNSLHLVFFTLLFTIFWLLISKLNKKSLTKKNIETRRIRDHAIESVRFFN